jgi:hypothetical protein
MPKFKTNTPGSVLNVRRAPGGELADKIKNGTELEVLRIVNGWGELATTAGGAALESHRLFVSAQYLTTGDVIVPPPPQPPGRSIYGHAKYQLGVNVLQYAQYGQQALKDGCRCVLFMDNGGAAVTAARDYPDAVIGYRKYHSSQLDAQSMFNLIDIDWHTVPSNFYCTLSNESDTWNPNDLPTYFAWFKQVADKIWAVNPKAKLCFGSWGHGNPNWTDPGVAAYWRSVVAPWLNLNSHRVVCDLHMYTKGKRRQEHPPADAKIIGAEWFETRHVFAYRNGLATSVRHIAGEAGVEAGHGGFPWAGYSGQQFKEWSYDVVNLQRATNPEPIGCALYHYGEHPGWRGYWVNGYYNELREMWRDDVPYLK